MLEVHHENVRLVGVYATPNASANDWVDIKAELKNTRAKGERMIVCGDLNASHPSWRPSEKTRGGSALQALLTPFQRRLPPDAVGEVGMRLPKSRGRQKREAFFVLRAPKGIAHIFRRRMRV